MDEMPGILERLSNLADNLELKVNAPRAGADTLEEALVCMSNTLYELDSLTGHTPCRGVRPWWL